MLERWIIKKLKQTMGNMPAVALLGPRQVGKTTLAKYITDSYKALYLDLENPTDLTKLSDPGAFLALHKDKLVILDEIQHAPELFRILRGLIDKNRQTGNKNRQFLILGSASTDLLRQSSESLAGRIGYMELSGLNVLEVPSKEPKDINKLWLRGGFPESYLAKIDSQAMEWLESFIRTYLERDIPQMGFRIPAVRLRRLWTMLAHLQGEVINASKLAVNLDVDSKTIRYYIDILTDLLLIRKLEPWHANVKKRLVKSPRLYIRDSGILHRLLGINNFDALLSNPVLGKSWEGFVVENILSILPLTTQAYFYRTLAGAEIDLVLQISSTERWAIEIKNSTSPKEKPGFHLACKDIKANRKYIIYSGKETFPVGNDITVISLYNFINELIKISNNA